MSFKIFSFNDWLSEGGAAGLRSFVLNNSYERMCWVYACVNRIATSASSAPLVFYQGKPSRIPSDAPNEKERIKDREHPVYQLFNPPNPPTIISLKQLMYRTFVHVSIDGLVFWIIERKKGVATSIDIRLKTELRPILVYTNADPARPQLRGWEDSSGKKYLPEDVLPLDNYNPKEPLAGLSQMSPSRMSLESEFSIAGWNSAFFRSGMKNPLLIQAKGQLTREQKKDIRSEVVNYYSGIDGAHGALLMQGGVEVKPLVVNPKDVDFIRGKELNREEVLAVFGVPPSIVGIFSYSNYCLTADALIVLANGMTRFITDIEPGDLVLSMGENAIVPAKVLNCWEAGVKDIYQIKTSSRTVKCSPEHKFYKLLPGVGPTKPRRKEWVDAKDLYVGDYIAVVNGIPESEGKTLLPNGKEATEGGMHQFGLYVGDGNTVFKNGPMDIVPYPMGVNIAIPDTDEDKNSYIEEARAFWITAKGDPAVIHRSKYVYSVYSVVASKWILDFGFHGNSHTKRIPDWVFDLTIPLKKAFLKGIFDSDGSYDKYGRVQIGLCNLELLNDIRDLCISVGYHVNNISSAMRTTNFGTFFLAAIVVSFGRGLDMNFKNHPLPDGLVWQKIRSIKLLDPEPTYDLEIQGTHNFFANWMVVHNSNVREQIRIFWEHTLLPKMNHVLELIQFNILDRDFPGVYAQWDVSKVAGLAPDPVELAAPASQYHAMGYSPSQTATILKCPGLEPDKDFKKPEPIKPQIPTADNEDDETSAEKPKKPKKPKDPTAGDPKPSDKPKPDNNNSYLKELLMDKIYLFAINVPLSAPTHKQIFALWQDLVISVLQEKFKDFDFLQFNLLPEMLCQKPTEKMRQEFIKNSELIAEKMLNTIYNAQARL